MSYNHSSVPRVLLAGIGGYGSLYTETLLTMQKEKSVQIAGMADPYPDAARSINAIRDAAIPLYSSPSQFWEDGNKADITMIASPIEFHAKQTLEALSHGSNVLCEKPLSGDWRDGAAIESAAKKAGKFVMIGYQWSYSKAVTGLKSDILAGVWGKPVRLKTLVLWPRTADYFTRGSGWAGRKYAPDGTPVFDSVANNAAAHYLHNMLYILGDRYDTSALPVTVRAQLSRANKIENFDTAAIRCIFADGTEALFLGSHCTERSYEPAFVYEFENGTISYDEKSEDKHCITGIMHNGTVIRYGNPFDDGTYKIRLAVENTFTDKPYLPCTAKTAVPHTAVINAIRDVPIADVPHDLKSEINNATVVSGLYDLMCSCYLEGKIPAETDFPEAGRIFAAPKSAGIAGI